MPTGARLAAVLDVGLSPQGVAHAERLAGALRSRSPVAAVYTSPLRAGRRQTGRAIAAALGLTPVEIVPDLRELDLGELDGPAASQNRSPSGCPGAWSTGSTVAAGRVSRSPAARAVAGVRGAGAPRPCGSYIASGARVRRSRPSRTRRPIRARARADALETARGTALLPAAGQDHGSASAWSSGSSRLADTLRLDERGRAAG